MLIKRKILVGVLISAVIVSLVGLNVHYYFATMGAQAEINDLLSQTVLSWTASMNTAAVVLRDVTTGHDYDRIFQVLAIAQRIGEAGYGYESSKPFGTFEFTARTISQNLLPYYDSLGRGINPTALSMFDVLAYKIENITSLIGRESWELMFNNGVDRIGLWKENGTLDAILIYCNDAR